LAPVPDDSWLREVCEPAERAIEEAREKLRLDDETHRRGNFPALAVGISHGGGQEVGVVQQHFANVCSQANLPTPAAPWHSKEQHPQHPPSERAGSTSLRQATCWACKQLGPFSLHLYDKLTVAAGFFKAYAPRLYAYYMETLDRLVDWMPSKIKRVYEGTAFAAITFNLGPRTVSFRHLDWANLAWGWCAITALGSFDADEGGHLVLWNLGLVIQFPRGTTMLIPSAMVEHGNTCVGPGQTRFSIAQYSASGLFRWVDNGFMKDTAWLAQASEAEKTRRKELQETRWVEGLKMLSSLSEFRS